ncbi:MAG TPA: DUF5683 domain-containing protein [Chryseolinea sp.]|nr:DUF5683 domain-containing protein [Chryseolinea sp.]
MKRLFLVLFAMVIVLTTSGQDSVAVSTGDSLIVEGRDTLALESYATRFDPRKALLYAAVIPGLGQIYTKKYWKLPLVYGGMIVLGYAINFYQDGYTTYKAKLYWNLENGYEADDAVAPDDSYTTANYRHIVDEYKRERDFMIILMGGMYLLQMIDAHVDAHLKEFDLNPKLQLSVRPTAEQNDLIGRQSGVSLILKF